MCGLVPALVVFALIALPFAIGIVFGRRRYKWPFEPQPPHGRLERTTERLVDPVTGKTATVWFDPRTGERHYVGDA